MGSIPKTSMQTGSSLKGYQLAPETDCNAIWSGRVHSDISNLIISLMTHFSNICIAMK